MNVISANYNSTFIDELDLTSSVIHVGSLLTSLMPKIGLPVLKQNTRKELLNELYNIYATTQDDKNRKRYYAFICSNYPAALQKKEDYYKYKDMFRSANLSETRKYLPLIKKDSYLWWGRFSHLKGEEGNECLRTMISECRDIKNRGGNIISYILGASGKLSI